MCNLKEELQLIPVTIDDMEFYRLNISMKEICERVGIAGFEVYDELRKQGFVIDKPILVSQKDLEDYIELEKKNQARSEFDEMTREEQFYSDVRNLIANSAYFDRIMHSPDGKVGLIDSCDNVVVPPIFDSCEGVSYLFYREQHAVVGKDGKFWLTPRDGSGKIITPAPGYDSVEKLFGSTFVTRNGKKGCIGIYSGTELIPPVMDLLKDVVDDRIFIMDNKIGYYHRFDRLYIKPQFTAIDFTTHQFCLNNRWGWLLEDGAFTEHMPKNQYDMMLVHWEIKSYLEKNPNEKPVYYSLDEVHSHMEDARKERRRKPSSYLKLPALRLPKGIKALKEIQTALANLAKNNVSIKIKTTNGLEINVCAIQAGQERLMRLEWTAVENKDIWTDLKLPMLNSVHAILSAIDNKFALTLQRDFSLKEISKLNRFISWYLTDFRKTIISDIVIE
ncbi:MAG: hypothetical protein NC453_11530 [Muribaculum sp.]|nr:hypothetical protein [Muribaculum sp.]